MNSIEELDRTLSTPSESLVKDISELDGDILILGAAGKMGPSLATLARRALDETGSNNRVFGVSRFTEPDIQQTLEERGITTIQADLLVDAELQKLPESKYVIYLVGTKFGTSGNEPLTWAVNSYLPGKAAEKFRNSSIVAFSTGNVYPYTDVKKGGSSEEDTPGPVGEYAQSCLGRERLLEYFSGINGTPMLLVRLNYAIDLRYGVLLEIAQTVMRREPVDLSTGYINVIWQGDANEIALRSLLKCTSPPEILNVTGMETVSVKWLAKEFGKLLGIEPVLAGQEESTALLSNASRARRLFGEPSVSLAQMIGWTADWVRHERETLGKPTQFQERKGTF